MERRSGSGRPKTACSIVNIEKVEELICSQDGKPGTSHSTRQIAKHLGISQSSVRQIAKRDLQLKCFKRTSVQVITAATKQKRLDRCRALLKRVTPEQLKTVFFTDEKVFYLDPHANCQNKCIWSTDMKCNIAADRLLVQRAKFSAHVMVSAGVSYEGKGRLHFVQEKAKINAAYYVDNLLPLLVEDCNSIHQGHFVFQQDGAPAHSSHQAQAWLTEHCPEFIHKDEWPPNSPDLNPLDYSVWGLMLAEYEKYQPRATSIAELKCVLQIIWAGLSQQVIKKAILAFRRRLQACIRVSGGHFEHVLK